MSTVSYKTRDTGYELQAAKGTDPKSATIQRFGTYNMPLGDYVNPLMKLQPVFYESLEATEMLINEKQILAKYGYGAVNQLPFYWFLGNATNETTYIECVSIGSGDRPFIVARDKLYNSAEYIAGHSLNCQCHAMSFNFDVQSNPQTTYICQFEGTAYDSAPVESIALEYAGAQDEGYKYDSSFVLSWDGDTILGLKNISIAGIVNNGKNKDNSSLFPLGFYDKEQIYSVTMTLIAGATNTKKIYDDFLAQDDSDQTTFKDLKLTIYSTATKFIRVDCDTVAWGLPTYGNIETAKGLVPTVTFTGIFLVLKSRVPISGGVPNIDTVPLSHYDLP